jgi:hypothetical protein
LLYMHQCNHYCVRECVRERRFIFSALFCQLKEIRKPMHAHAAARPIGCSARGLLRIAQQQRAREGRGHYCAQRAARKLYGTPRVRFASRQPDAVSYVCQQFTLGPTEVQISWFIGRVHASVNSKFVMSEQTPSSFQIKQLRS